MTLGIGMPKDATPEELMELRNEAVEWLQAYFNESLDAREASGDPGDDMIGWLMTTEVEGERLTRENILDILGLLMIAGPRHGRRRRSRACSATSPVIPTTAPRSSPIRRCGPTWSRSCCGSSRRSPTAGASR